MEEFPESQDRQGIINYLARNYIDDEMIAGWLVSRSRLLHGRSPEEVIAEGRFDEVALAARGWLSGLPASEWLERNGHEQARQIGAKIIPFPKPSE
jgi:hypothetical protein